MEARDLLAIHELLANYGHVVDDADWSKLSEVFTPEGCSTSKPSAGAPRPGLTSCRPASPHSTTPSPTTPPTRRSSRQVSDTRTCAPSTWSSPTTAGFEAASTTTTSSTPPRGGVCSVAPWCPAGRDRSRRRRAAAAVGGGRRPGSTRYGPGSWGQIRGEPSRSRGAWSIRAPWNAGRRGVAAFRRRRSRCDASHRRPSRHHGDHRARGTSSEIPRRAHVVGRVRRFPRR